MSIFTYIKLKYQEFVIFIKRKWYGDVRPEAVKPPKKRKTNTTKRKTK